MYYRCSQVTKKKSMNFISKTTNVRHKYKKYIKKKHFALKSTVQAHTGVTCSNHDIQYCCSYSNKNLLVNIQPNAELPLLGFHVGNHVKD